MLDDILLKPSLAEEVAKWPHEWQADFVLAMVTLMDDSPKVRESCLME